MVAISRKQHHQLIIDSVNKGREPDSPHGEKIDKKEMELNKAVLGIRGDVTREDEVALARTYSTDRLTVGAKKIHKEIFAGSKSDDDASARGIVEKLNKKQQEQVLQMVADRATSSESHYGAKVTKPEMALAEQIARANRDPRNEDDVDVDNWDQNAQNALVKTFGGATMSRAARKLYDETVRELAVMEFDTNLDRIDGKLECSKEELQQVLDVHFPDVKMNRLLDTVDLVIADPQNDKIPVFRHNQANQFSSSYERVGPFHLNAYRGMDHDTVFIEVRSKVKNEDGTFLMQQTDILLDKSKQEWVVHYDQVDENTDLVDDLPPPKKGAASIANSPGR